jgi:hypothetical protein
MSTLDDRRYLAHIGVKRAGSSERGEAPDALE